MLKRKAPTVAAGESTKKKEQNEAMELFKTLFIAIVLATLFRSLAYEPFHIPSGSMKDTLLVGDYLFVSKFSYGYSRYSFPFGLPVFSGRVLGSEPKRGDVIVFRLPPNPRFDYIKRLVGLPGDKLQVRDGKLIINGSQLPLTRIEDFVERDERGSLIRIPRYIETLPEGTEHHVLDQHSNGKLDNTLVYEVPEGHYFLMGDNRDNSLDSRVLEGGVGYVPAENLVGRAEIIFFSLDESARFWELWKWPTALRYDRFFQNVE